MKLRLLFIIVLPALALSGCSVYHAIFTKVPGIYMTQQDNLGGRLELREDNDFWYYWEMEEDTFGTSNGCWYKKFNKIILNSIDSTSQSSYAGYNLIKETYNDSIDAHRVMVLNDRFYPVYNAAWIIKRRSQVLASGLTDRDGVFTSTFRAGDSLIVSAHGFNTASHLVGSGGLNEVVIQLLKGGGGQYVPFKEVSLKIRKKNRLELEDGGGGAYLGDVYFRYFDPMEIQWP